MFSSLKYAIRSLLKTRGFAIVAILTLALGIGASSAIFSIVNTVLLRPLPYTQPERLMRLCPAEEGCFWLSPADYFDLQRETTAWNSIEAWINTGVTVATSGEPVRVTASVITGGLLPALGVNALSGRIITAQDGKPGAPLSVVISHGLWQRGYGADPSIVGRDIQLNGTKFTVVGVMPKGFQFPPGGADVPDVWMPLQLDPANPGMRDSNFLNVLARLKPGVSVRQAQQELDALLQRPGSSLNVKQVTIHGMHDLVIRSVKPALKMLMAAVGFLLLIACMNVANLLLARAEARQGETSIRAALGAGWWQLARQFTVEGLLISLTGAVVGLMLAYGGLQLMLAANETGIPRAAEISMDGSVVLFATVMSVLTTLVFGLVPLVHVSKANLQGAMRSRAGAAGANRFRQIMVVSQLALALVLLTGTGLMIRAFWNLQEVDAGFDPRGVVTTTVGFSSGAGHPDPTFATRLEERLNALPGVGSASVSTALPPVPLPSSPFRGMAVEVEGFTPVKNGSAPYAEVNGRVMTTVLFFQSVSSGYFDTLRIRLAEGRVFKQRDDAQAPKVAMVNQTAARVFWGNKSPVGQRIRGPDMSDWYTVVGVIADVKNDGVGNPTGTEIYVPYAQPTPYFNRDTLCIAVRSRNDPAALFRAIRREIANLDPALPVAKMRMMTEVVSASQSKPRFLTLLLSLFAGMALVLAAVGIYGVVSYSVAQRTREFGIRMALGAQSGAVLGLVIKRGAMLTACGVAIGLAGAFALTRFLSGSLFGVTATDPATFVVVSLLLAVIAVFASYIPARRATRVDPLIALRAE